MLQDVNRLKYLFEQGAKDSIVHLKPNYNELGLVEFEKKGVYLYSTLKFHHWSEKPVEGYIHLEPQSHWFNNRVMSFMWIDTTSTRFHTRCNQIDWLNCFRNEHYEQLDIWYNPKEFAKMVFNLGLAK